MTTTELAEALRPVIKEVVKEAMQTELREILTEAVEIASRPDSNDGSFEIEDTPKVSHLNFEKPKWVQELDSKEQQRISEGKAPLTAAGSEAQHNSIMNLLGQTAKSMTDADRSNFR